MSDRVKHRYADIRRLAVGPGTEDPVQVRATDDVPVIVSSKDQALTVRLKSGAAAGVFLELVNSPSTWQIFAAAAGDLRAKEAVGGNVALKISAAGVFTLNSGPEIHTGSGTPEGVVTAPVGSTFHRTDGGAGTSFYVKESGTGNTGWVGK